MNKMRRIFLRRFLSIVSIGIMAILAAGCNRETDDRVVVPEEPEVETDPTPTPEPTPVFNVACKYSTARAGQPDASGVLPPLLPCTENTDESLLSFSEFLEGDYVSADLVGEAVIDIAGCAKIYVFHNSSLKKMSCSEAELGTSACSLTGTTTYINDCLSHLQFAETLSGRYEFVGTYAVITYHPEEQRSTVIVLDGAIFAQPVLDMVTYELGDTVVVEAGQFWYTIPGVEVIEEFRPIGPLPLDLLPTSLIFRDIEPWFGKAIDQALFDNVLIPDTLTRLGASVFVQGGGGFLEDPAVSEALVIGVDWQQVAIFAEIDPEAQIPFNVGDGRFNAQVAEYDPERAQNALLEAGVPEGYQITFLVEQGSDQAAILAGGVAEQLSQFNLELLISNLPESELRARESAMRAAGEPVIVFIQP